MKKIALLIALTGALFTSLRAPIVSAAPRTQSTPAASLTPTEEPLKPPYVFPTPVFIPTYPGDTPAAPRATGQSTGQDTYTVQSGDSPWTISQKVYGDGTKYPLIMSANGLTSTTRLRVGTVLKIPPIAGAQPPAPAGTPPASTPVAPIPQLTALPIASPTLAATPGLTPTATSILPGSIAEAVTAVINIFTAILAAGAFIAAILAFLVYYRARRMEGLNTRKRRLQIRQ